VDGQISNSVVRVRANSRLAPDISNNIDIIEDVRHNGIITSARSLQETCDNNDVDSATRFKISTSVHRDEARENWRKAKPGVSCEIVEYAYVDGWSHRWCPLVVFEKSELRCKEP
jgi:hypothetical protein